MRTIPNTSSVPRHGSSDPPPTDAALLAGTRTDFGAVFDRHAEAIYRYCARRIGTDAVDDAVADTFVIAYERRARFDAAHTSALPWLYGIATNVLRRYRAAEARYRKQIHRENESVAEDAADRAVARVDAGAAIRALGAELDKIGTVMSRLNRARTRLRAALLALGITLEGPA